MSNYYTLRTKPLLSKPIGTPDIGSTTSAFGNLFLTNKIFINNAEITPETLLLPRITSLTYTVGRSTANVAGYETLTVHGTGFSAGAVILVDDKPTDVTTFVSSTELTFTTPQKVAGVYSLFVVNSDGSTGASSTGITYS